MSITLSGIPFPFWIIEFDKDGDVLPSALAMVDEQPNASLTDLYIFSHGWNNDRVTALDLYTRFFGVMNSVLEGPSVTRRKGLKVGIAGVIWPSILFPGDTPAATETNGGGSASRAR